MSALVVHLKSSLTILALSNQSTIAPLGRESAPKGSNDVSVSRRSACLNLNTARGIQSLDGPRGKFLFSTPARFARAHETPCKLVVLIPELAALNEQARSACRGGLVP